MGINCFVLMIKLRKDGINIHRICHVCANRRNEAILIILCVLSELLQERWSGYLPTADDDPGDLTSDAENQMNGLCWQWWCTFRSMYSKLPVRTVHVWLSFHCDTLILIEYSVAKYHRLITSIVFHNHLHWCLESSNTA